MNESTEKLLAQLEQATSSTPNEPLDDETKALRESWLALGELLDNAAEEPSTAVTVPVENQSNSSVARFVMAIAAMLLVALAAWSMLSRDETSSNVVNNEVESNVDSNPSPSDIELAESPVDEESSALDEFAWDDSFDEQLAATSQAIRSVQSDWSGGDRRYSVLLDQFEEFNEQLSEGSL